MSDAKRRIKTIAGRLDLGRSDNVITIRQAKFANETDAEYQARMNERDAANGSLRPAVRFGSVTITPPAICRPAL